MSPIYLIAVAVVAIALLLFLVMKLKWPAYLALLAVSVLTALAAGIAIQEVIPTVIAGMGTTLGNVALLVGLGAMLGGIIEKTGGAEIIARKAAKVLGKDRLGPALLIASGLVAIPIFFDVAFIILVPIIFSFAKASGHKSPIALGAPVAVFMVFIHNAVPPHPGIVGSTTLLNPDVMGLVTILGILLAIPMGFVIWWLSKRIMARGSWEMSPEIAEKYADAGAANLGSGDREVDGGAGSGRATLTATDPVTGTSTTTAVRERTITTPSAGAVVALILLPIVMIAIGTVGKLIVEPETPVANVLAFIGAPALALLVACVLAMYLLGVRHGWGKQDMSDIMDSALAPAAIVVFVTGAGGVFARVLTESGIGDAVSGMLVDAGVPIIFLAFILALIFKVAQGSGTVATLTAAGLVQSTVAAGGYSELQVALIILAIAMGSVSLSHINDSGFWIATKFIGLSVAGGLKTWTFMCTVVGFLGMAIVSVAWLLASAIA
ncbi:MAG: SLC13 family permease [Actinomycetes bacterium]|uniref:GntT/GntP/DsdX family permease n=1 Tax=Agrococcus sp. BE272 TaxID=2817727 RepID=UPI0028598F55|nr:SLC13 family permease [Agrococcus sp. BE272]MDR7233675.1 GntP family gluconate:H+ symporter [Agrococcus sp. BE272]